MKRHDSTKEKMYNYLKKWRATDLDMKAFCEKHNISYYSFKYWKYRQRDELTTIVGSLHNESANLENGRFLPMQIQNQPTGSDLSINFPNGVLLTCPSNVCLDTLSKLIKSY